MKFTVILMMFLGSTVITFGQITDTTNKALKHSKHNTKKHIKNTWGISTGVNLASFYLGNSISKEHKSSSYNLGFTGGISTEKVLNKLWSLQAELNCQRYNGTDDNSANFTGYTSYNFTYANLPLVAKYKVPFSWSKKNLNKGGFRVLAGLQYSYLLFANGKETWNNNVQSSIRSYFYKNELSGIIGAEYFLPLPGGNQIGINGRYQMGLTNIESNYYYKGTVTRSNAFSLTIGYKF